MTKLTCELKLLYCGLSNMSSVWAFILWNWVLSSRTRLFCNGLQLFLSC